MSWAYTTLQEEERKEGGRKSFISLDQLPCVVNEATFWGLMCLGSV